MATFKVKKTFRVHYLVALEDERIDLTHWHLDDKGIVVSVKKDGQRIPPGEDPAYDKHIDSFLGVHLDLEEESERFSEQSYEAYQSLSAELKRIEKLVAEATVFRNLQTARVELSELDKQIKKFELSQEYYEDLKYRVCGIAKEIYQKWLKLKQYREQTCQQNFEEIKEKISGIREQITTTQDCSLRRERLKILNLEIQTPNLSEVHRKELFDQLRSTSELLEQTIKQQILKASDANFKCLSNFIQDLENRVHHENPKQLFGEAHAVEELMRTSSYLRKQHKDDISSRLKEIFNILKVRDPELGKKGGDKKD